MYSSHLGRTNFGGPSSLGRKVEIVHNAPLYTSHLGQTYFGGPPSFGWKCDTSAVNLHNP